MPKVYIPNKSFHDFSAAGEFGELIYLTEGIITNRTKVSQLLAGMWEILKDSEPEDMLLVSSMALLNALASSALAAKHGRVNYLIFTRNGYVLRETILHDIINNEGGSARKRRA